VAAATALVQQGLCCAPLGCATIQHLVDLCSRQQRHRKRAAHCRS
jgi:hypothetical protein